MATTCKLEGNKLVITIDLQDPTPSTSGKTLLVASTHGTAQGGVQVAGKPVAFTLSAWVKA
jgi:hypothetical protein